MIVVDRPSGISRRNYQGGVVTRTELGRWQFGSLSVGSRRGGGSPRLERFISEDAECVAGDEMALDVEGIVNGGVNGQESLGRSRRFESLHLAFASSRRLMRILSPIVPPKALLVASRQPHHVGEGMHENGEAI